MPVKIDFQSDAVVEWHRTESGPEPVRVEDYTQTFYVSGPESARDAACEWAMTHTDVVETAIANRLLTLQDQDRSSVLAIELRHTADPQTVARHLRQEVEHDRFPPGTLRFYNVDLTPQFRYCLETDTVPTATTELPTLSIEVPDPAIADRDVTDLRIDGQAIDGDERATLATLRDRLVAVDPDVLVLSSGELVPLLHERALATGVDLDLGRHPGWEQLAGENTFESYGRVGYAAARYDVPGRVVIDTSNSFLWADASIAGLCYLARQSHKPLQETAWGSIGSILTAMQIRAAYDRDVLVPWNKWQPESFKSARTLHEADRGGFIMDPVVGLHTDVAELDFASLYPEIMCTYNISPDTILCDCHPDRTPIPGLPYAVCPEPGFIGDVLRPLLDERQAAKRRAAAADSETDAQDARAIAGAIKWILVSCFGYQGYRNAKFGRIECHEAINAYAREILLETKSTLESHGWEVVHGIVDSVWVTPIAGREQTPLETVAEAVSTTVDIELELEARYDWVTFVPRRGTNRGALTRYVAKRPDGSFKLRGIEARQRSTPPFVATVQRDLLAVLDETRSAATVVDRAEEAIQALESGEVAPDDLTITQRLSKPLEAYEQETLAVAAFERAHRLGMGAGPGRSLTFVVVAADGTGADRVRLAHEPIETYDVAYYTEQLLRATESVLSPLGWDRERIDRYRQSTTNGRLDRSYPRSVDSGDAKPGRQTRRTTARRNASVESG